MSTPSDPFAFHPELRDRISDPLTSPSRGLTTAKLAAMTKARGLPSDWWYSDSVREAEREKFLAGRRDDDLWVFGYGSLMWDPAIRFEEVRRAHVPGYARRFILKDIYGGRGTVDAPGLMVALDEGPGCDGLAFRISRENVEAETEALWRRERIGPAYAPEFVDAIAAGRRLTVMTFVADHESGAIDASLTRRQQVAYCASGTGFMGSSLDYLANIDRQFGVLGIRDDDVSALLREALDYVASSPAISRASPEDAPVIHALQMRAFAEEGRLSERVDIPPLTETIAEIEALIRTQTVLVARRGAEMRLSAPRGAW